MRFLPWVRPFVHAQEFPGYVTFSLPSNTARWQVLFRARTHASGPRFSVYGPTKMAFASRGQRDAAHLRHALADLWTRYTFAISRHASV